MFCLNSIHATLGVVSYRFFKHFQIFSAGADAKLGSLDSTPTGTSMQSQQQPATGAASQYPALPPGYGYYYPAGTPSMMPMGSYYTPIIPMSGMVSLCWKIVSQKYC